MATPEMWYEKWGISSKTIPPLGFLGTNSQGKDNQFLLYPSNPWFPWFAFYAPLRALQGPTARKTNETKGRSIRCAKHYPILFLADLPALAELGEFARGMNWCQGSALGAKHELPSKMAFYAAVFPLETPCLRNCRRISPLRIPAVGFASASAKGCVALALHATLCTSRSHLFTRALRANLFPCFASNSACLQSTGCVQSKQVPNSPRFSQGQ